MNRMFDEKTLFEEEGVGDDAMFVFLDKKAHCMRTQNHMTAEWTGQ